MNGHLMAQMPNLIVKVYLNINVKKKIIFLRTPLFFEIHRKSEFKLLSYIVTPVLIILLIFLTITVTAKVLIRQKGTGQNHLLQAETRQGQVCTSKLRV